MQARSILDADMTTVGGWLRSGLFWWLDELRGLVPLALRGRTRLAAYAFYDATGAVTRIGQAASLPVLIDPQACLARSVDLPRMGNADLVRLVAIEADRLFPLPAADLLLAIDPPKGESSDTRIYALPLATARTMLASLAEAGVEPLAIYVASPDEAGVPGPAFGDAFATAGLIAPRGDRALRWWALAALLFVCNIGLLVWRDAQSVSQLEELVTAQAPAVRAARAISGRITGTQRQAAELASRRSKSDPRAALAAVTRALPAQAWVQRYSWSEAELRLSGYRRQDADVAAALRKSGRFGNVKAANAETIAEIPTGLPFDITATFGGVRQ